MTRLIGAALVCVLTMSCFQVEQNATLYPDGSGKLVFKIGVGKSLLAMAKMAEGMQGGDGEDGQDGDGEHGGKGGKGGKGGGGDDITKLSEPSAIAKNIDGIVAWGEPKKVTDDEFETTVMTGYFEDITKLKIYKDEGAERTVQVEFALEKTDKGMALSIKNGMTGELDKMTGKAPGGGGEEADEFAKKMMEAMKPMMKGLRMSFAVTVPGAILEASGYEKSEGRTASTTINDSDLFGAMEGKAESKKKFEKISTTQKITWAEATVSADDQAAFKKELGQAKEDWKKIEAEWNRKAEEKAREAEKKAKDRKDGTKKDE